MRTSSPNLWRVTLQSIPCSRRFCRRIRPPTSSDCRSMRSEERRVGKEWRSLCDWSSDVCSSDLAFAVADQVRPESAEAVRRLHQAGIEVVMMTGDAHIVAESVARDLAIDTVLAQVLPEDKAANIERLQEHEIGRASCRERVEITV